ncbi:MAG: hypothetical protein WD801_08640 [Gemmatimonadaceae bacterium]
MTRLPTGATRATALMLAAVLLAAACKKTTAPPEQPQFTLAGTYPLRTINGFAPPQIVYESGDTVVSVVAGVLFLLEDSTFTDSTDLQVLAGNTVTTEAAVAKGFFRTTPDSITFYVGALAYRMGRDDVTLTQLIDGVTFVYRQF